MAWRTILPEKMDRAHPASTGPLLNSSFTADTSRSALAKGLPFAMLVDLFMPALDERIFNKRVERCQRPRNLHPHVPPYLSRGDSRGLTRHGLVRQLSDGTPPPTVAQRRPIVPNRQSRQLKSVPPLRLGGRNFLSHRLAVPRQMPQPRPPCWSRSTKRPPSSPILTFFATFPSLLPALKELAPPSQNHAPISGLQRSHIRQNHVVRSMSRRSRQSPSGHSGARRGIAREREGEAYMCGDIQKLTRQGHDSIFASETLPHHDGTPVVSREVSRGCLS